MQLLVSKSDAASQEAHRKLGDCVATAPARMGVWGLFPFFCFGARIRWRRFYTIFESSIAHLPLCVAQQLGAPKITVCPAALSQKIAAP